MSHHGIDFSGFCVEKSSTVAGTNTFVAHCDGGHQMVNISAGTNVSPAAGAVQGPSNGFGIA